MGMVKVRGWVMVRERTRGWVMGLAKVKVRGWPLEARGSLPVKGWLLEAKPLQLETVKG
jgi:hypothetical protein